MSKKSIFFYGEDEEKKLIQLNKALKVKDSRWHMLHYLIASIIGTFEKVPTFLPKEKYQKQKFSLSIFKHHYKKVGNSMNISFVCLFFTIELENCRS